MSAVLESCQREGILNTFDQLGLSQETLDALAVVGFTEPTEIQSKTIGIVADRKDLIASAQTGSGKTAAYALPILDILRATESTGKPKTRALVIVPTRELALQVCGEFERFGSQSGIRTAVLYGGVGYRKQVQTLHRGADVIVATPGRLLDCLNRNFASLSKVQVVVLDEADRLLDMGFMPQVRAVIAKAPEQRQTLMFSATIDARMKKIAEEFLREPEVVATNVQKIEASSIEQQFHYIKEKEKEAKLLELLQTVEVGGSALVFTKTRMKAGLLAARLKDQGILAEEIHGDISQSQRVRTLTRFRNAEFNVLIATDVAARGLDIPAISHVVNYDLPMLAEDYVHRIGRTGRAGKSGIAHSFVSNDQRHLVRAIHAVLKNEGRDDDSAPVQRPSREAIEYAARISDGVHASNGRSGRGNGGKRGFDRSRTRRHGSGDAFGGRERSFGNSDGRRAGNSEGRKFGNNEGRKFGNGEGRKFGHGEGRKFGNDEERKTGNTEGRKSNNAGEMTREFSGGREGGNEYASSKENRQYSSKPSGSHSHDRRNPEWRKKSNNGKPQGAHSQNGQSKSKNSEKVNDKKDLLKKILSDIELNYYQTQKKWDRRNSGQGAAARSGSKSNARRKGR